MSKEVEILPPKPPAAGVLDAIAERPWAITEEYLQVIVSVAMRDNEPTKEALEAYRSQRAANSELTTKRGAVAIINMQGPMFRYATMFTAISGGTTYDAFARELTTQVQDPAIRAILLNWDSPGGEANGVSEAAAMIHQYAQIKPIESYVGGSCCSAAYWLACATNKITIDRTAMLGSIGVRLGIRDTSERDAKSGVRNIEFISSRAPNKRTDFSSEEGRARIQKMADQMEGVFIADVAAYRGVTEDDVVMNFGSGGVEIGQSAIDAGMADALGSFEAVVARLTAGNGTLATERTRTMSTAPTTTTAAAPATPPAQPTMTHTADQVEAARAEAATAAQTRIAAILGAPEAAANRTLAEHFAFKTGMTAEAAIEALKASAPTAPAPAATTTTTTVDANAQRSKDATGGLTLAAAVDDGRTTTAAAPAPTISASDIYAKRRAAMNAG